MSAATRPVWAKCGPDAATLPQSIGMMSAWWCRPSSSAFSMYSVPSSSGIESKPVLRR
ncbi:Uncharacterised protein [Mycobacteroides abscessus subsp. abscessus]|nr:Uncharacterised protein [Mycobacteroides abscessus subsp. abscessus]